MRVVSFISIILFMIFVWYLYKRNRKVSVKKKVISDKTFQNKFSNLIEDKHIKLILRRYRYSPDQLIDIYRQLQKDGLTQYTATTVVSNSDMLNQYFKLREAGVSNQQIAKYFVDFLK